MQSIQIALSVLQVCVLVNQHFPELENLRCEKERADNFTIGFSKLIPLYRVWLFVCVCCLTTPLYSTLAVCPRWWCPRWSQSCPLPHSQFHDAPSSHDELPHPPHMNQWLPFPLLSLQPSLLLLLVMMALVLVLFSLSVLSWREQRSGSVWLEDLVSVHLR